MLRMTVSTSAQQAKSYYNSGLSKEDYYSKDREIVGNWHGKLAKRLGLEGQIKKGEFDKLCDNYNPQSGERLTQRTNENRRVGYDINFHAPKSVSIVYGLTKDVQILSAFRESVTETMCEMEKEMKCRVRKNSQDSDRTTGNMLWGEFIHFTARPVNGIPDPHLHAHCYTFNATYDKEENCIKAGQFGDLKRDGSYFEATFHSRFSNRMRELGYDIDRNSKGWEISGVSEDMRKKFSKRTELIEKLAKEKQIKYVEDKAELGAKTRESKKDGLSGDDLSNLWSSRITPEEFFTIQHLKKDSISPPKISAKNAMDFALEHSFERQSVISEKKLIANALRRGYGSVSVTGVNNEAQRQQILKRKINGQVMTTTKEVLREEKEMCNYVNVGKGTRKPLNPNNYEFRVDFLNVEQKKAVNHILQSSDNIIVVEGGAGTGKTTMMKEVKAGIQEGGKKLYAFSPTSDATKVLKEEGFGDANTVTQLLLNSKEQAKIKDQVILIDEAGLLGSKTMNKVFQIAKEQNSRVLLSGDTRQHASVERGDALRVLKDHTGIETIRISEIQRQRSNSAYKDAVKAISNGEIDSGFEQLDKMGAITEIRDWKSRHETLAKEFVNAVEKNSKGTFLAVAPTHMEGNSVTQAIRSELKTRKKLSTKEQKFTRHINLSLTEAEKKDFKNYTEGQAIQFHRNTKGGFKAGSSWNVVGNNKQGNIIIQDTKEKKQVLPIQFAKQFSVYHSQEISFALGDKIRITQNGKTLRGKRLNNGSIYSIKGFTDDGDIMLSNNSVIGKDFKNFNHGYCTTSHASQGKSVTKIFIAQSSESFKASNKEQFYVSVSRGKQEIKIYTDDKNALKQAVCTSGERKSASELFNDKQNNLAKINQHERQVNRLTALAKSYATRAKDTYHTVKSQFLNTANYVKTVTQREVVKRA